MKRTNALKAAALGLSIMTVAGIAPALIAAEPDAVAVAEVSHDEKAIKIIEKSFDAVGGRDLISSAEYIYQKGSISIPAAGITGSIETYVHAPDKLFVLVNIPMMGENRQGVNGDVAWSSDPMNGPRLLPEDEAKALIEQSDPNTRLNYKDHNPTIEYVDEVEFDGQKAYKIRLVDEDDNESFEYYNAENGYMIGNEAKVPTAMGNIQMTSYMREYKELGGVMQPTKMVQKAGPQEFVITISEASYEEIDASVFELPEAVKALVKAKSDG